MIFTFFVLLIALGLFVGLVVAFAAAMAAAPYVMLEIEYPRLGLIRVDAFDEVLVALQELLK